MKVFIEIFSAFSIGFFFGVAKKIGFWGSFAVSLIISAVSESLSTITFEKNKLRSKLIELQEQNNHLSQQVNNH